jgi:predicted NACHT family NTPase
MIFGKGIKIDTVYARFLMSQSSIAACSKGIDLAKNALIRKGLSQQELSRHENVSLSRNTVDNFFNGKNVRYHSLATICNFLELDIDEVIGKALKQVTELAPQNESSSEIINIDELVKTVREKIGAYIEERCGTMRVLDMTQPIGLDDIYTSVNILEKITGRIRVASIEEMITNVSREDVERFSLGTVREERVPGLEAVAKYLKLIILGKPGAGKTTFLKHLALLCIRGKFQEDRIPSLVTS